VRSRSRLNIAKALTFRWDRITFERDGAPRTFLGALQAQVQGIACEGSDAPSAEVRAYKRLRKEDKLTVFMATDVELETCDATVTPGRTITFAPEFELAVDGTFGPPPAAPLDPPIQSTELIELIRAR